MSVSDLTQLVYELRMGYDQLSAELTIEHAWLAVDINQIRDNIACLPRLTAIN